MPVHEKEDPYGVTAAAQAQIWNRKIAFYNTLTKFTHFDRNRDARLSHLLTELPDIVLVLEAWQKHWVFRNSEKKNLCILVHRAPSCAALESNTCKLNTL